MVPNASHLVVTRSLAISARSQMLVLPGKFACSNIVHTSDNGKDDTLYQTASNISLRHYCLAAFQLMLNIPSPDCGTAIALLDLKWKCDMCKVMLSVVKP